MRILNETTEEKIERFKKLRRWFKIDIESETIPKKAVSHFCDNFIDVMQRRIKNKENLTKSKEQLKAYTFMKRVLIGD